MALTAAQKQTIAKMFGSTPTLVSAWITRLGATLTSDVETDIVAELARWETASESFESIEPKESNFGIRIGSSDRSSEKNDIRRNVASLLEWPYGIGAASMGSIAL